VVALVNVPINVLHALGQVRHIFEAFASGQVPQALHVVAVSAQFLVDVFLIWHEGFRG
jgi:hypothetical protein